MKRDKSAAVGLVICFVAVIAIVGVATFNRHQKELEDELAKTEEENQLSEWEDEEDEPSQITQGDHIQAEIDSPITPDDIIEDKPVQSQQVLSFSSSDTLIWPIDGNVIIPYSMDETVYFSTLDQYKYNPALIISGEQDGEVLAAADGEVLSITEDAQTGTTVTLDLGNGYQAIYGQLEDVQVDKGDRIEQSQLLGFLSEPTKYYSVEGYNLYFQLLKDGESVNPMEYLDIE